MMMKKTKMIMMKNVALETVCGITSTLPKNTLPEIAFAGKSNVGKSSLINGLMNRKSLARTSAQPGKTQTINYYNINQELYFVDLPGYGYAKVSEKEKIKWGQIKEETQATIRCVPFAYEQTPGVDMVSGKPAKCRVIIARSY